MVGLESEGGEITQSNLGDILMYSYADFVRQYDEAAVRAEVLREVATMYERQTATGISATVSELARLSLHHEVKLEDVPTAALTDEIKSAALLGAIWRDSAEVSGARRGTVYANAMQFEEQEKAIYWPLGRIVKVSEVDFEKPPEHIRLTNVIGPGRFMPIRKIHAAITGELRYVDLDPEPDNPGQMHISVGKKRYTVGPLINRDNDYRSPIRLEVL